MKYIITEEQNERLTLFRKLSRRDSLIKDYIHEFSKRPLTNFHMVVESVFIELLNELQIRINSKSFYWLKVYILDNYSGLIYTELSKNNKDSEQIDESVIDDIEDYHYEEYFGQD